MNVRHEAVIAELRAAGMSDDDEQRLRRELAMPRTWNGPALCDYPDATGPERELLERLWNRSES